MAKKLLVIFGVAAVAGFLFRDRVAAFVLEVGSKLNEIKQFKDDETWTEEEA